MQVVGLLSGGAPVVKKYQVAETVGIGEAVIRGTDEGVDVGTTTSLANMIGVCIDNGLALAAGGTVSFTATPANEAEVATYGIIVNPDAIIRLLMSGGATESTALTEHDITSSTATVMTTGDAHNCPDMDNGVVWFTSGANVGSYRKITATAATTETVGVAWSTTPSSGDLFIDAPYWPGNDGEVQLSTLLTQADASIATGTGAELVPFDFELNGSTDSYLHTIPGDHVFAGTATKADD